MSFTAKSNSIIKLFLPRLHFNDTRQFIIDTFHHMAIGRVFEIDMKQQDDKNPFAFIKVQLYNTDCSIEFMENILDKGTIRIPLCIHGKEGYWVVNNYITKKNRGFYHKGEVSTEMNTKINTKIKMKKENYNDDTARPYKNTSFTMKDINIMDKDFDVLSYLIFQKCQGQGQTYLNVLKTGHNYIETPLLLTL